MAYPEDLDSSYNLRDYNFAVNDNDKIPYDESLFKGGYKNANESETLSVPDAHNENWMYNILYANLRYTKDTAIENKNLLATKKATANTLGQIKVGQGLKVLSDGTLMLENPISGDKQSITYDIPVGMFMLWGASNIPDLFIEPKGQIITKADYPELFQFAVDNHSDGTNFTGWFSGTVSDNQCTLKDLRNNFIRIASNDGEVGTYTSDGLPSLTINSSNHTHGTITTNAGTAHNHGVGSLSYNADGWVRYIIINEDKNFATGGKGNLFIDENTADSSATSGWGFDGDSNCRRARLRLNTSISSGASWSGSMANESSHTHSLTIGSGGSHIHTLSYPSGLAERNDTKVMPANYGFKLILKAKPSPQQRTLPIGTILDYTGESAPDGFLIADGSTILKTDATDLYNWAVNNNIIKPYSEYIEGKPHACYYEGSTSEYFIIPNLIGVYRRGELQNIGTYSPNGAPDIQGTFLSNDIGSSYLSGAFSYVDSSVTPGFVSSSSATSIKMNFSASNSNDCYGRYENIQPETVNTLPILKY